ncbi:MAG TPA: hypothetical protein PKD49_02180 [Hyphomicrobium sp.]|nr:hypothetical protein [Hyphomicrobium sp.]
MRSDLDRLAMGARTLALACALAACAPAPFAHAQTARRDRIADLIEKTAAEGASNVGAQEKAGTPRATPPAGDAPPADPRAGDPQFEQAAALMAAVDAILKDSADNRSDAERLPSREEFILPPLWRETREDREEKVRNLLDAALSIVTNVPVVEIQKRIEGLRKNIRNLEDESARLKEKQLTAPKQAIVADTVQSLQNAIDENIKRAAANRDAIKAAKGEIATALKTSGIELGSDQVDLLLDSVLSGDLVRLVAAFEAARLIDGQLAKLIATTGDNMNAARKYFAMHAALFAMLVHAQDATIAKIDTQYMPKLDAILADIKAAKAKTATLLKAENRPDQKRALEANRESQKVAEDAAQAYRRYLQSQREQIAKARIKAIHDLRIADNTYETVEASVQLRNLMRDSSASFEAIQKLEAPSFEHIFKNDELRREFENLTRRLDAPSS